jgi:L-aspartate oxidase
LQGTAAFSRKLVPFFVMSVRIESDFLVIGSGIAGLSFALKAAQHGRVAIITKKEKAESNTNYAQGGIAAALGAHDSFDSHVADTLTAGAGLCHRDAVEMMVREGPTAIEELMSWGAKFSRDRSGLVLGREGGHSRNRIVHAKDRTGREVESALLEVIKSHPNIEIYEDHLAIDLLTEHQLGREAETRAEKKHCWGAYALDVPGGRVKTFLAKVTVLCTGGCGHVYAHTTNPDIATGDGIAMAWRAGALLANLEFMQFHPTTLYHPAGRSFLISEAVRGHGAILRTRDGEPFMERYHPMKDLAPRDIVARAIDTELKRRGEECVFLDVTHLPADEIRERFPTIYERCLEYKIDMTAEPIPVVPAAHYICGGVATDLSARTSIVGLYACGETACTGVHGANRLASNSLLEAVVFSRRAYEDAREYLSGLKGFRFPPLPDWDDEGTFDHEEWVLVSHDREEIRSLMWDYVGIVRSGLRLERALRRINLIAEEVESFYKRATVTEGLVELRNLVTVAQLMIRAARHRKESRGLHYTTDYPRPDDRHWRKDTLMRGSQVEGGAWQIQW